VSADRAQHYSAGPLRRWLDFALNGLDMPENSCRRGHTLLEPRDRLPSGMCRKCDRENQAAHAARRKAGMQLLRAFEAVGGSIDDIGDPKLRLRIALAAVGELTLDQARILRCQDPDTYERALAKVSAAAAD
jgi:hypothetical protein